LQTNLYTNMILNRLVFVLCLLTLWIGSSISWKHPSQVDAVHLQDIVVLSLNQGEYTHYKRHSPIPQLRCIGGDASKYVKHPQSVQCYNLGNYDPYGNYLAEWMCETDDLPHDVTFGKAVVKCEGINSDEDQYVLKESCGLEYTLVYEKPSINLWDLALSSIFSLFKTVTWVIIFLGLGLLFLSVSGASNSYLQRTRYTHPYAYSNMMRIVDRIKSVYFYASDQVRRLWMSWFGRDGLTGYFWNGLRKEKYQKISDYDQVEYSWFGIKKRFVKDRTSHVYAGTAMR